MNRSVSASLSSPREPPASSVRTTEEHSNIALILTLTTGKQRKNRMKTLRGTAKVKGAKAKKDK